MEEDSQLKAAPQKQEMRSWRDAIGAKSKPEAEAGVILGGVQLAVRGDRLQYPAAHDLDADVGAVVNQDAHHVGPSFLAGNEDRRCLDVRV